MYWNTSLPTSISFQVWLTLTWDVLKCVLVNTSFLPASWLTLTWDVLKYNYQGTRCFGERD